MSPEEEEFIDSMKEELEIAFNDIVFESEKLSEIVKKLNDVGWELLLSIDVGLHRKEADESEDPLPEMVEPTPLVGEDGEIKEKVITFFDRKLLKAMGIRFTIRHKPRQQP